MNIQINTDYPMSIKRFGSVCSVSEHSPALQEEKQRAVKMNTTDKLAIIYFFILPAPSFLYQ